jgi:hypothetical protein
MVFTSVADRIRAGVQYARVAAALSVTACETTAERCCEVAADAPDAVPVSAMADIPRAETAVTATLIGVLISGYPFVVSEDGALALHVKCCESRRVCSSTVANVTTAY